MRMIMYLSISVFGILGSYVPVWLFGAGFFDMTSILGGIIGSFVGLYVGYKINQTIDI